MRQYRMTGINYRKADINMYTNKNMNKYNLIEKINIIHHEVINQLVDQAN